MIPSIGIVIPSYFKTEGLGKRLGSGVRLQGLYGRGEPIYMGIDWLVDVCSYYGEEDYLVLRNWMTIPIETE